MRQNFPLKSELLSRENKAFSLTGVGEEKNIQPNVLELSDFNLAYTAP